MATYGVTDLLSLTGGAHVLDWDAGGHPWLLGAKYTVVDRVGLDVALGASAFSTPEPESGDVIGAVYGVTTIGSSARAATIGLGWRVGNPPGGSDAVLGPSLMVGGDIRVARRTVLVGEAAFGRRLRGYLAAGPRFIGERVTVEVMAAGRVDRMPCCVPMVNVVWGFGGR